MTLPRSPGADYTDAALAYMQAVRAILELGTDAGTEAYEAARRRVEETHRKVKAERRRVEDRKAARLAASKKRPDDG